MKPGEEVWTGRLSRDVTWKSCTQAQNIGIWKPMVRSSILYGWRCCGAVRCPSFRSDNGVNLISSTRFFGQWIGVARVDRGAPARRRSSSTTAHGGSTDTVGKMKSVLPSFVMKGPFMWSLPLCALSWIHDTGNFSKPTDGIQTKECVFSKLKKCVRGKHGWAFGHLRPPTQNRHLLQCKLQASRYWDNTYY